MATTVYITGLVGSQASAQEILGATGVNRGYRVPALSLDGVAVGTRDDTFGGDTGPARQKDVAVVPGHIYGVDIDDPETRKRLSRDHGIMGMTRTWWVEVPDAAVGAQATATLTSDGTNVVAGDTVTINNVTYRFESTLALANDVHIGASADASLQNLVKAVNQTGVSGTDYFAGTVAPTGVTADAENTTTHTVRFVATTPGTAGNAFPSTETSAHLSFGSTTFTGGLASGGSDLSLLSAVPVRSLLTEGSGAYGQSFISRGFPIQQQEILYPDQVGGAGGLGTSTSLSVNPGNAPVVDLTNPAERRALRLHPGRWCVGALDSTLVTVRGLMTTKSLPTSTGGYGLSSDRGFRIPAFDDYSLVGGAGSSNLGYVSSTTSVQVDLSNANVRRALRRNVGRWIVVSAP